MAPEVATEGYTERSDIWSLGCVLFELVTCWLYGHDEMISKLKEIRDNPIILDETFEEISKVSTHRSRSIKFYQSETNILFFVSFEISDIFTGPTHFLLIVTYGLVLFTQTDEQ